VSVASDPARFAAELERLARAGDRHAAHDEAVAWSEARRARFDAAVQEWTGELAGVSERSPARSA
jgi:hypothetical protein